MDRVCPVCGKPVDGRPDKVYCSRDCKHAAAYNKVKKPPKEKPCLLCGKIFNPKNGSVLYCSDECRKKALAIRRKGELERAEKKPCVVCGKLFIPRNSANITCSPECSRKRRRKQRGDWNREQYGSQTSQQNKKRGTMSDLASIAKAAIAAGMSYGEYVRRLKT